MPGQPPPEARSLSVAFDHCSRKIPFSLVVPIGRVDARERQCGLGWRMRPLPILLLAALALPVGLHAQKPRERDLQLPIGGTPGPLDAITDVAGVEVGHTTLI